MSALALRENPLQPLRQSDFVQVGEGLSLRELYERMPQHLGLVVCALNDVLISREHWDLIPRNGDRVIFTVYPHKAGVIQSIIGAILIVAGLLLTAEFPVLGPYLVQLGASLLIGGIINLLIPVRGSPQAQEGALGVFSTSLAGNAARLDQPIWKNCGRIKITPPFACYPYVTYLPINPADPYVDCDEYYYALFALGEGEQDVERSFIGKTQLSHFADVQRAAYLAPGVQPSVVLANVVTSSEVGTALELKKGREVGGYVACRPGDLCYAVGIDVVAGGGLGKTDSSGNAQVATVTWRAQARAIDDFGNALTDWTTIGTETRAMKTTTPQRWSTYYTIATPYRPEIRLARIDNFQTGDTTARDQISWTGLRGYIAAPTNRSTTAVTTYGTRLRLFAWYDAAAGTSSYATSHVDTTIDPSYAYYVSPPAAKYWADIRPELGTPQDYVDVSGVPSPVSTVNYGMVVYDSAAGNFFAWGLNQGSVQYEYRLALNGTVISQTAMTSTFGAVNSFTQGAMIFFNGAWRAWWVSGSYTYYLERSTSAPTWTSTRAWVDTTTLFATVERVIGVMTIGSTLVVALGNGEFVRLAYSTTGIPPYNTLSPTYSFATAGGGALAFSGYNQSSLTGTGLIRIGSTVAIYGTYGTTPYVAISNTTFSTLTFSAITLDGGAPPTGSAGSMNSFIGNAAGTYVMARWFTTSGTTVTPHLAVSTNGIDFTTVVDAAIWGSDSNGAPVTDLGHFIQPLLSQGTKFLYERSVAAVFVTPPGSALPGGGILLNPNTAHFEVVMRSGSQLSGQSQRDFSMIVRGYCRTWSPGGGWSAPVFTRNAAWWLADLWTNPIWGEGLDDSRVDLLGLYAWAQTLDSRQDHFDYSVATATSSWDLAQLIARSGRARASRRGGVYTVTRDEAVVMPFAALTPRNTMPKSMVMHQALPQRERPDGIVAQYLDLTTWDTEQIEAPCPGFSATTSADPLYNAGLPAMSNPVYITLDGVTGSHQARREAIYHAYDSALRRATVSAKAELEGLVIAFMDPLLWMPQIVGYGQAGDVVDFDPVSLLMTLSEPADFSAFVPRPQPWEVPAGPFLTLQRDDLSLTTPVIVTPGPTANQVRLPAVPDFDLYLDSADRERPKYLLGASTANEVVKAIGITDAGNSGTETITMQIEALVDDPRVHTADVRFLPGPGDVQDPVDSGINTSNIPFTVVISIDAIRNKGQDHSSGGIDYSGSANGVTVSGLNPDWVLAVTLEPGPYVAWSEWASDTDPYITHAGLPWGNSFVATSDLGTGGEAFGAMSIAATAAAANAAFSGGTLTGSTSWTFWFNSDHINDNRGGLTIRLTKD